MIVCHKPGKEHIILDALNGLAGTNSLGHNCEYAKLNTLFVYYTTLVQINSDHVKHIFNGYTSDKW